MTKEDKQLLEDFECGRLAPIEVLYSFSVDLQCDFTFIKREIREAIQSGDAERIQATISLIWLSAEISEFVDLLNELLINPNHRSHQQIAKALQDHAPSPTTVPFIKKALESNFDYLEYTCSETGVIAKWFSWLLFAIGTDEAINLMKEYSDSADEGIRNEMLYRLKKVDSARA